MRTPLRSNNRYRSKPGRNYSGNPLNRVYDSTGPEGKVRGTPQQIIDKYETLSQDASTSGDHVSAENYLQHAEHYARILSSVRRMQEKRREDRRTEGEREGADIRPHRRMQRDGGRDGGDRGDRDRGDRDRGDGEAFEKDGDARPRQQRLRRSNGSADANGRRPGTQEADA